MIASSSNHIKRTSGLNGGFINIKSFNLAYKKNNIIEYILSNNLDFFGLMETGQSDKEFESLQRDIRLKFEWKLFSSSHHNQLQNRGIGIFMKKNLVSHITASFVLPGWFRGWRLAFKGFKIFLGFIYAPVISKNTSKK